MDSSCREREAQSNPFRPVGDGERVARTPAGPTMHGEHSTLERGRAKSVMILPQVHLRKPCYDFYFL